MTIQQAPLISNPKGSDKVPASDGSGQPVALSLQQIAEFVGGNIQGLMPPMSLAEYEALENKESTLYFIADAQGLERVFYGTTLLCLRGEADTNMGFPLVFPFVFS